CSPLGMTGTGSVNATMKGVLAGGAVVLLAVAGFAAWHYTLPGHARPVAIVRKQAAPVAAAGSAAAKPVAASPATATPAAVASAAPPGPMTSPCPAPASAPPKAPDGASATQAQMDAARDSIQTYVNALEAYQACLNRAADAMTDVNPATRQSWLEHGNGAVDEANLLAAAFAAAHAAYREAHPGGK
ncbi:MAG: hypothetical protein POG24_11835, partial [Acidocella sp.]|nr:hypothetical protein [Acidocella sp.]